VLLRPRPRAWASELFTKSFSSFAGLKKGISSPALRLFRRSSDCVRRARGGALVRKLPKRDLDLSPFAAPIMLFEMVSTMVSDSLRELRHVQDLFDESALVSVVAWSSLLCLVVGLRTDRSARQNPFCGCTYPVKRTAYGGWPFAGIAPFLFIK